MKKTFLFITILNSIATYAQTAVPDTISAQQLDEVEKERSRRSKVRTESW